MKDGCIFKCKQLKHVPSGTYKREDWCSDCHIEFRGLIAETIPITQQLRVLFMRTIDSSDA